MRLKKMLIFVLVFAAVYGFTAVDEAYSDMMDREGSVSLRVRRVNSEFVTFSIFGQAAAVNTKELKESWSDLSNKVTDGLDQTVGSIRGFLGFEDSEMDYSVFKTEIL